MSGRVVIGDTLAGYRLVRKLGRGATGTVFEAEHPRLPRTVAVKVLALDDAGGMFARESRLLATVRHENVVQLLDAGTENGASFLVMELIQGETLKNLLARGRPPRAIAARVGSELLAALGAIHASGVLHRDLTPSNLMMRDGSLVVLDFGLARLVGDATLTKSRGVRLSLAYAPPERFNGQAMTVASDLYQAGLVLFELATGRHPFPEEDPSRLATAHLMRAPPSAKALAPDLPSLIDRLVDKALRKDPRERYGCAEAMRADWDFLMNPEVGR